MIKTIFVFFGLLALTTTNLTAEESIMYLKIKDGAVKKVGEKLVEGSRFRLPSPMRSSFPWWLSNVEEVYQTRAFFKDRIGFFKKRKTTKGDFLVKRLYASWLTKGISLGSQVKTLKKMKKSSLQGSFNRFDEMAKRTFKRSKRKSIRGLNFKRNTKNMVVNLLVRDGLKHSQFSK